MNNIITPEELKQFKDIGSKIDSNKIEPIIYQAQSVDLKDYLGTTFYMDVLNNLDSANYQLLLSGGTFTVNNITYYMDGVKAMLADLFMGRYVLQVNNNFTPFGAVTKETQDGTPTERNTLKDISFQQNEMAASKWDIIKLYLESNKSLFPTYGNNTCTVDNPAGRRKRFHLG